jgi:hypothetical protein
LLVIGVSIPKGQEKPHFCPIDGCWRWYVVKYDTHVKPEHQQLLICLSALDRFTIRLGKTSRRHHGEERIITEPLSGCYPSLFQHRNNFPTPSSILLNDNFSPPLPDLGAQHTIGSSISFPPEVEYADEAQIQWMHFTQSASDLENSPLVSFFTPTYAEHQYNGSSLQQY